MGTAYLDRVGSRTADNDASAGTGEIAIWTADRIVSAIGRPEALDCGENAVRIISLSVGAEDNVRADCADDDPVGSGPADDHVVVTERDQIIAAETEVDRREGRNRLHPEACKRIDDTGRLANYVDDAVSAEHDAAPQSGDRDRVGADRQDPAVHRRRSIVDRHQTACQVEEGRADERRRLGCAHREGRVRKDVVLAPGRRDRGCAAGSGNPVDSRSAGEGVGDRPAHDHYRARRRRSVDNVRTEVAERIGVPGDGAGRRIIFDAAARLGAVKHQRIAAGCHVDCVRAPAALDHGHRPQAVVGIHRRRGRVDGECVVAFAEEDVDDVEICPVDPGLILRAAAGLLKT